MPVVVLLVLGVVQVALVGLDTLRVQTASRDAARAAAASAAPASAARAAVERILPDAVVDVWETDGVVSVRVTRTNPTDVALIGALVPDVTITFVTSMAAEPP